MIASFHCLKLSIAEGSYVSNERNGYKRKQEEVLFEALGLTVLSLPTVRSISVHYLGML